MKKKLHKIRLLGSIVIPDDVNNNNEKSRPPSGINEYYESTRVWIAIV